MSGHMRPILIASIVIALIVGAGTYVSLHGAPARPVVTRLPVTTGDLHATVRAMGTLEPTRTVQVGAMVSGTVKAVDVDFNSLVRKGQVIVELDPALLKARLASLQATLDQVRITEEADAAKLETDRAALARTEQLWKDGLTTAQTRDAAQLQARQDELQVSSDVNAVRVAKARVDAAQVDLDRCTIRSPVDGVVIARDVDPGQTVASRMKAPTLLELATDLTSLTLAGNVDEADVARLRPGQPVTFTVDSYPGTRFHGHVRQIRLDADTTGNVITYQTVIDAANPDLRLRPGMTAEFTVETDQALGVPLVPNGALRFEPTRAVLAAFGAPMPPATTTGTAPAVPLPAPPAARITRVSTPTRVRADSRVTIDDELGPVPRPVTSGRVWILDGTTLKAIPIRLGLTDGIQTQVVSGDIHPGEALVTAVDLPGSRR